MRGLLPSSKTRRELHGDMHGRPRTTLLIRRPLGYMHRSPPLNFTPSPLSPHEATSFRRLEIPGWWLWIFSPP